MHTHVPSCDYHAIIIEGDRSTNYVVALIVACSAPSASVPFLHHAVSYFYYSCQSIMMIYHIIPMSGYASYIYSKVISLSFTAQEVENYLFYHPKINLTLVTLFSMIIAIVYMYLIPLILTI